MRMRWTFALLSFAGLGNAQELESGWTATGFLSATALWGDSVQPALRGGYGRQLVGGSGADAGTASALDLEARLGVRWRFDEHWSLLAHGLAREGASAAAGRGIGLVEAGLEYLYTFADDDRLRVRVGQFFFPGSRENIEPLWVSPYTIDSSLLNSWVGEEFRPVGVDLGYRFALAGGDRLELGATLFCCNDTSGALLAWRGFSRHHRLSLFAEDLPTAPVFSLAPDGVGFTRQRLFATEPFGPDLDHRLGYALRSRFETETLTAQLSWVDNRGDRQLYGDQYSWDTRWLQLGLSYEGIDRLTLAAEWQHGKVDMGLRPDPIVDFNFDAVYLLAAWAWNAQWQSTVRLDFADLDERDFSVAEDNRESSRGLTLNLAFRPDEQQRWMLEYSVLNSKRPGAVADGFPENLGNRLLQLEWRRAF